MRRGRFNDLDSRRNYQLGFIVRSVVTLLATQTAIPSVLVDALTRMGFHKTLSSLGIFTRTVAEGASY